MPLRPLSPEDGAELDGHVAVGLELLPLPDGAILGDDEPLLLAQAVAQVVDAARAGEGPPELPAAELALALGAAWGEELGRALGWAWAEATLPGGLEGLAIAAPDASALVLPLHHVGALLADPTLPNDVVLLTALLLEGRLPPSAPGAERVLG